MTDSIFKILLLAILFLISSPTLSSENGSNLLEQVLKAHGGLQKITETPSIEAKGSISIFSGFPGTFRMVSEQPGNYYLSWDIGYINSSETISDGAAWEFFSANRELVGNDRRHAIDQYFLFSLINYWNNKTPVNVEEITEDGQAMVALSFQINKNRSETFYIDPKSNLIIKKSRKELYEEGLVDVTTLFSNYKVVNGLNLPFKLVRNRPDKPTTLNVEEYKFTNLKKSKIFESPFKKYQDQPYKLKLSTLPGKVYKEDDGHILIGRVYRGWGTPYAPTESWLFHVSVSELYGRNVKPQSAKIELFSGNEKIRTITVGQKALEGARSYPVARFAPRPEIYNFRHSISEAKIADVDKMIYSFKGLTPEKDTVEASLEIPVKNYKPHQKYIFPVKGKFLIPNAHDFDMRFHSYEGSQHFAYDILPLGPNFELAENDGEKSEDFFAFRNSEVIAPADGKVVYARNDVPDTAPSKEYLATVPDPRAAIAGNLVIIDHGSGEFSLFAHMSVGTVLVKEGDQVKQGQKLGLVGSAGSGDGLPHLHYQLQSGQGVFEDDGLPVVFENVFYTGFMKGPKASVLSPGLHYEAK